jgi:hypothetical protein
MASALALAGSCKSSSTPPGVDAGVDSSSNNCQRDEDCRPGSPVCEPGFGCAPCRLEPWIKVPGARMPASPSPHCPGTRPYCVPGWEYGEPFCAPCNSLSSQNTCSMGSWCVPAASHAAAGECTPNNCAAQPIGRACELCLSANASACVQDGGRCAAQFQALCRCEQDNGSGCPATLHPLTLAPERIVAPCQSAGQAVRDCLLNCPTARSACDPATDAGS